MQARPLMTFANDFCSLFCKTQPHFCKLQPGIRGLQIAKDKLKRQIPINNPSRKGQVTSRSRQLSINKCQDHFAISSGNNGFDPCLHLRDVKTGRKELLNFSTLKSPKNTAGFPAFTSPYFKVPAKVVLQNAGRFCKSQNSHNLVSF